MMKTERQERIQDKYEFEKARVVEGKGIARELRRLEGKRCGESGLFFFFFRYQDKSIARISVQSNVVGLIQTSPQSHTQPGARRIRTITMQHSRQHCTGKQRRSQDSEGTRGSHEGAEWTEIEQDRHGAGRKEATKDEVRKIEVFESVRKKNEVTGRPV